MQRRPALIPEAFYRGPVPVVAEALLGQLLVREDVILRITEVEAYGGPEDGASHARHGRTLRNAAMWGPGGRAYLYFCYGVHWMLNVATGPAGDPAAVLVRGAEVVSGLDQVLVRRRISRPRPGWLAGPGKVAQALGLDGTFDGQPLFRLGGLELRWGHAVPRVHRSARVGVDFAEPVARARLWRFQDGASLAAGRTQAGR